MIITLENEKARYEIYLQGIERSNYDNTMVRWEQRYNYTTFLTMGSSLLMGQRLHGSIEAFINDLMEKGFKVV